VAVGGDGGRESVLDEAAADFFGLLTVPAEQARRVDLERPAALG
jgi:hypothetical protein